MVFALLFGSCQKEQVPGAVGSASFVLNIGDGQTKTVSQGENVDRVYYEVWDDSFTRRLFPTDAQEENFVPVSNNVAYLNLKLLKDQTFNVIFWAQNSACTVYSWTDLKNISVNYAGFTSNNKDVYDAFYAVTKVVSDGENKSVSLYRPFAQLNFGTETMKTSLGEFTIGSNTVSVSKVAKSFNTVSGTANADSYINDVSFVASQGGLVQQESESKMDLEVGTDSYFWVGMNYMFVASADQATVTVNAEFVTSGGTITHTIDNVPLKKNYKTNIVGDLFTNDAKIKVIVVPDFLKPDLKN